MTDAELRERPSKFKNVEVSLFFKDPHCEMRSGTLLPRKCLISFEFFGVADGARTHDNRNHNPGLYQLSYSHL